MFVLPLYNPFLKNKSMAQFSSFSLSPFHHHNDLHINGCGLFGIEELGFSVDERDLECSSGNSDAITAPEDIAEDSTISIRVIGNMSDLSRLSVGEGKEVVASSESIEVIVRVSLDLFILGEVGCLSEIVDSGQILVHFTLIVHVGPEGFSTVRIITTSKVLFTSVVNDGNTNRGQSESSSSPESNMITIVVKESGIIVVINKVTQKGLIRPGGGTTVVALQVVHGVVLLEDPTKSVEERIVQDTAHRSLVASSIRQVGVKDFTDSVNARGLGEFSPEVLGNIRNSINSETINIISIDNISDPFKKGTSNKIIVLIKISKLSKPASFLLALVVGVNITAINVFVIIVRLVERELVIIDIGG